MIIYYVHLGVEDTSHCELFLPIALDLDKCNLFFTTRIIWGKFTIKVLGCLSFLHRKKIYRMFYPFQIKQNRSGFHLLARR